MKIIVLVVLFVSANVLIAQDPNLPIPVDSSKFYGDTLSYGNSDSSVRASESSDSTRKIIEAPTSSGQSIEEGKIAMDIWVDENGNVVKVQYKESKSNSGSNYLINLATKAAKTIRYEKKPGSGIEYVGYEIFEFRRV